MDGLLEGDARHAVMLVLLHDGGVGRVEKIAEAEPVRVAPGKRYPSVDETAVLPRPRTEGDGCIVGRWDCTSTPHSRIA